MKNFSRALIAYIVLLFFSFGIVSAHAQEGPVQSIPISLRVEAAAATIVDHAISVPSQCDVVDSGGAPHTFEGFVAICALQQAQTDDLISSFQVTDWGFGFSLDAINDVMNAPDWSELWVIRLNSDAADAGIDSLALQENDELLLTFGPWPMPPLQVTASSLQPMEGDDVYMITQMWDDTTNQFYPYTGSVNFFIGDNIFASADGALAWSPQTPGEISVWAEAAGATRSKRLTLQIFSSPESEPETANEPPSAPASGGGGGVFYPQISQRAPDAPKAIAYLAAQQNADGSFGNVPLYSDWAAIAFGAYQNESAARASLKNFLLTDAPPGNALTDYERRAMALMSIGIDPYSGTATNYIQKIFDAFDGTQFGDPKLVNDDIFALFPLVLAGYGSDDFHVASAAKFILGKQDSAGSWGSTDMTAAAIQALELVDLREGANDALRKARAYLATRQQINGSFDDNVFSTSWAMQALAALDENEVDWFKGDNTPASYLYEKQAQDGGMDVSGTANARIWATSYAIPAALGMMWGEILGDFHEQQQVREESSASTSEPAQSPVVQQSQEEVATTEETESLPPIKESAAQSRVTRSAQSPNNAISEQQSAQENSQANDFQEGIVLSDIASQNTLPIQAAAGLPFQGSLHPIAYILFALAAGSALLFFARSILMYKKR